MICQRIWMLFFKLEMLWKAFPRAHQQEKNDANKTTDTQGIQITQSNIPQIITCAPAIQNGWWRRQLQMKYLKRQPQKLTTLWAAVCYMTREAAALLNYQTRAAATTANHIVGILFATYNPNNQRRQARKNAMTNKIIACSSGWVVEICDLQTHWGCLSPQPQNKWHPHVAPRWTKKGCNEDSDEWRQLEA